MLRRLKTKNFSYKRGCMLNVYGEWENSGLKFTSNSFTVSLFSFVSRPSFIKFSRRFLHAIDFLDTAIRVPNMHIHANPHLAQKKRETRNYMKLELSKTNIYPKQPGWSGCQLK